MRNYLLMATIITSFAMPLPSFGQLPTYEPKYGASGLDLGAMDTSISPCSNFYQYACGLWRQQNPIPSDQSRWSRFNELAENNRKLERTILEKAAQPSPTRSALDQKIGDFYGACMDESGIERKGVSPLKPELDEINGVTSKAQLAAVTGKLQARGLSGFFRFFATPDLKDSTLNIASLDQGGISLPDRDYYLKTDKASVDLLTQYQQHVATMLGLLAKSLGVTWDSQAKAAAVVKLETALAQASMDRVERRNPNSRDHPMTTKDLPGMTPGFQWTAFFAANGSPSFQKLNTVNPAFFKQLTVILNQTSLDDIKTYLTWRLLLDTAAGLPKAYVDANFDFFGRTLTGAKEIQPRWKRCVSETDANLGEALGQKYVEVAFAGASKTKALEVVGEIEKSMQQDIETAAWMTTATKQQALAKLKDVSNKIGYPEKWRDYTGLVVKPDDMAGNELRAAEFERRRNISKIGKPVDKSEWGMTPPTVNAYYNPPENNINFPAGILQPPFYNPKADDAVNYGAIGVVVGHELTHGFDDQGRRYDGSGNLRDWWTPEDASNFTQRADCIVNEYSNFSPVDGVKLNGKLTLGENAADNGGIQLAYAALMRDVANHVLPKTEDGFTEAQRFFLGYAQIWCENTKDAELRRRAVVDPHSPGEFRVNGVVQNTPQFQEAFSCKAGDRMVAPKACRVW